MVLLVTESGDDSTNSVIDWLSYYRKEFKRLNLDLFLSNEIENMSIEFGNSTDDSAASFDNRNVSMEQIDSVWFRRSVRPFLEESFLNVYEQDFYRKVKNNFYYEYSHSILFLLSKLSHDKKKLGNYNILRFNKLEMLSQVKEVGIEIPPTLVTNDKTCLVAFKQKHRSIITKAISEVFDLKIDSSSGKKVFLNYTEEVTDKTVESLPVKFGMSLFQKNLEKEIEIRVFYLNGELYSMAIFSQLDTQTSTDYRKYTNNRNVPYKLPHELENKIRQLMAKINLDTASIDFVKTKDRRFVLLDINPRGQYGMTSYPCNYHLDKKIADYLTNHE
ncbi:grasp-with-spasm system ATP-grasp peptide maturase [Olivibacter sp. CPCC 100613]|uniref:grasp-with-spasm system ATP-grasp peptide maturase n=1 Tax=Olivibacter sp. CPCC 100613 TaxID=3079931 RepID=UPI002FFCDAA4